MTRINSSSSVVSLAILIFVSSGLPLAAQQREDFQPRNVISANPFGIMLGFFNAEYERVISRTSTIGFGGSTIEVEVCCDEMESDFSVEAQRYVNLDVFWRFYPGSNRTRTYRAPVGWAFGVKAGITGVEGETYFGYGFDLNRSWVLGPNDNFYVGLGMGLKRLVGAPQDVDLALIPTIRIANVGFIF
jgi:hypothetical protein